MIALGAAIEQIHTLVAVETAPATAALRRTGVLVAAIVATEFRVEQSIRAGSTEYPVGAGAATEPIVAIAADDHIIPVPPGDEVRAVPADQAIPSAATDDRVATAETEDERQGIGRGEVVLAAADDDRWKVIPEHSGGTGGGGSTMVGSTLIPSLPGAIDAVVAAPTTSVASAHTRASPMRRRSSGIGDPARLPSRRTARCRPSTEEEAASSHVQMARVRAGGRR